MLLPRVHLDAPDDWMDAHEDDLVDYADPRSWDDKDGWAGPRHPSWASEPWRRDAAEALRRLIRHVRGAGYVDRILGWHIGSGIYGEWHAWNAVYCPDTSRPFVDLYRQWLSGRYPESPPPPRIPTLQDHRQGDLGMFRDPGKWRWLVDHAEFFHQLGAETLSLFARAVKEETGGRCLVVAFNGYLPDLGVNHEIDHRAFDRVLHDPNIDAFASPHSYWRRGLGDDGSLRGFPASVRQAGKLWMDEADDRTSIAPPSQWKHVQTPSESVEVLWRAFAQALTHNCGMWFMDQGGMWHRNRERGWYQHPDFLAALAKMQQVAQASMSRPRTRSSEVAVVASLRTAFHLGGRAFRFRTPFGPPQPASGPDSITHLLVTSALEQLTRCGAPFDLHLLSELLATATPAYKAYVFLDAFLMSDPELAGVRELRDRGKTLLFYYAPAFLSDSALCLDRMRGLLGMPVELTPSIRLPTGEEQRPGFHVPGCDEAVARRGNTLYCPAPPLAAGPLREIFRQAGAHIWLETDDPLSVGGGHVAVHAASAGRKVLKSPAPADWVNVRSGETIGRNAAEAAVDLSRGQTLLASLG
jgi:hypothetical protein